MKPELQLLSHGVCLPRHRALIFSDTHLGYSQVLQNQGLSLPLHPYAHLKACIQRMIDAVKPERIIIAGDIKHEFSKNLTQEWKHVRSLIAFLQTSCKELVLIRGNHDNYVQTILSRFNLELVDHYAYDDVFITHGHKPVETTKFLIFGHEHPALTLTDEFGVSHTYKCHLLGKNKLVLPSLNPLTFGFDVLSGKKPLSPLLCDLDELTPVVSGLVFPAIKRMRKNYA